MRKTKVFASKTEARDRAAKVEHEIDVHSDSTTSKRTLANLLERYRDHESTKERSVAWEQKKIDHLHSIMDGDRTLSDLDAPFFAQ